MAQWFRRALPAAVVCLAIAGTAEAKPKKVTINVAEYSFSPQNVAIVVGDTVEWKNTGVQVHTATSGYGINDPNAGVAFDSGALSAGGTYRKVFTSTGKFPYFCVPHEVLGMKGSVSVVTTTPKRIDVQVNDNLTTQSFFFSPASITAAPGDTIKWTNVGHTIHTVTSGTYLGGDEGVLFDSGAMNVGATFRWVVSDTTGTLAYHCIPHAELGMVGSITLQASGAEEPRGPVSVETHAFPNPSRGGVVLSFGLARAGAIAVEVLDAQGRAVAELFRGEAAAGAQRFAWSGQRADGKRVPAGQYFYRVSGAGGVTTGRLTRLD